MKDHIINGQDTKSQNNGKKKKKKSKKSNKSKRKDRNRSIIDEIFEDAKQDAIVDCGNLTVNDCFTKDESKNELKNCNEKQGASLSNIQPQSNCKLSVDLDNKSSSFTSSDDTTDDQSSPIKPKNSKSKKKQDLIQKKGDNQKKVNDKLKSDDSEEKKEIVEITKNDLYDKPMKQCEEIESYEDIELVNQSNPRTNQDKRTEIKIPKKKKKISQENKSSLISNIVETKSPKPLSFNTTDTESNNHGFILDFEENLCESQNADSECSSVIDTCDKADMDFSQRNSVGETVGSHLAANISIDKNVHCKSLDRKINSQIKNKNTSTDALRQDLVCPICHEILFYPVSLPCGHTFCQECLHWWISSTETRRNCPTCRKQLNCDPKSLCVNTALRSCLIFLFSNEVKIRAERNNAIMEKLTRGENSGFHTKGFCAIYDINDNDEWNRVKCYSSASGSVTSKSHEIYMKRNIIMDEEDQRMHLSLAVQVLSEIESNLPKNRTRIFLELCLIIMEEDEADEGIPFSLNDEDDEQIIVDEERFDSLVEMKGCQSDQKYDGNRNEYNKPVMREQMCQGTVAFEIDLATYEGLDTLHFLHCATKTEMLIKLPIFSHEEKDINKNSRFIEKTLIDDSNSDDDEDLDMYENDGFVVDDEYVSDYESTDPDVSDGNISDEKEGLAEDQLYKRKLSEDSVMLQRTSKSKSRKRILDDDDS